MSFLTDEERQSLEINAMILHVVGEEGFTPEPQRTVEHAPFFIARILDTDVAPVYSFTERSATRLGLEKIARGEQGFEEGTQELSYQFSQQHRTSAREGAFFIFELTTDNPRVKLYSLVKYDYREAIEQADSSSSGQNLLRRIVHAFIADKKAIQKSALVRVVDGEAEAAISAHDRVKAAPEISDYFAAFLGVERTRSDKELNEQVVQVLRKTLQDSRDILPDRDVARALRYAKGLLRDRQEIREEAVADAVLAAADNPVDEETRATLIRRVTYKMRAAKLSGLVFPPDRQVLRRPPLRRVKTTEGVVLTYPDDANALTVQRQGTPNGGEIITITTDRVVEDTLVRDSAS
jgi:hypothetical protein